MKKRSASLPAVIATTLLVSAPLGGCGGGDTGTTITAAASATAARETPTAPQDYAIRILSPAEEEVVEEDAVKVSGTVSPPDAVVTVSGYDVETVSTQGADGDWEAEVEIGPKAYALLAEIISAPAEADESLAVVTILRSPLPELPDPKASTETLCDYLIGNGDNARFVGSIKVRNTGNIGVVIRARARWDQLGSAPIRMEKEFQVPVGKRRTVQFNQPASIDEILAHQSAEAKCRIRGAIIDTFGDTGE